MTLHRLCELLIDLRFPGGCPDCNAHRTLTPATDLDRVYILTIHHDTTCPTWAQIRTHRDATP